jgi:hypothetical protein
MHLIEVEEIMQQYANFSLSILLRHEEYGWAAQCLEYDISAQGRTLPEVKAAIAKAFVSQVMVDITNGNAPLADIPPAPREYWAVFGQGERLADRTPFYIPPAYMVRAAPADTRIVA